MLFPPEFGLEPKDGDAGSSVEVEVEGDVKDRAAPEVAELTAVGTGVAEVK